MDFKKDPDYVSPHDAQEQTRPSYERSRGTVEKRQKLQRTLSGNHLTFESAVNPGTWHQLNLYGEEAIQKRDGGYMFRQPALDHIVQYAAINEHYHSVVRTERNKAKNGLSRRNSFDLHQAFVGAVADPGNLRLVTHDEHGAFGGSTRMGQFSKREMHQAKMLFEDHLPVFKSSPKMQEMFHKNRPRSSVPLPGGNIPDFTMSLRPSSKK